jgi:flagellin
MTVINTNVGALMARTYASKAAQKTETSMERLSSGLRINGAADDAAGMAVANKMNSQLSGIKMAIRNSQDGISLVQTAESGMGEISNMILRMRELAVQMENGIYTSKDRDNAQLEVNALLQEVDKIAVNTKFNGVDLLDGKYDQTIRAGNTNAETIRVAIDGLKTIDTAKIEAHAVERAVAKTTGGAGTRWASQNQIETKEGTVIKIDTSLFSDKFKETFKNDSLGTFSLSTDATNVVDANATGFTNPNGHGGIDNALFDIDAKTGELTAKYQLDFESNTQKRSAGPVALGGKVGQAESNTQITGAGANVNGDRVFLVQVKYLTRGSSPTTHYENLYLTLTDKAETQLEDIKVETSADSTRAIETLDKALEQVSSAQAKLGAIQNRLSHNIDNLSKGAMLTEQSVGRVVDADFATETSNLSKQQILSQAATAMLAQANQSKQSVLSLLQ